MATYKILSLDGGGIRGVFTARILEKLEADVPGFLASVDLFAGTSTGGILALGLAFGLLPRDLIGFYENYGPEIFDDSWWDNIRDIGKFAGADYENKGLVKSLRKVFGSTTLGQLRKKVLISSFDLDNSDDPRRDKSDPPHWKAKFFHNYPSEGWDGEELIVDVAARTSAAPTYFPTYQGHIDGGVVANNPSMAAVAQALHKKTGGRKLEDLRILSVGTGRNADRLKGGDRSWGQASWAPISADLIIDGEAGVADFQCRQILEDQYCRVNKWFDEKRPRIAMDDIGAIPRLLEEANEVDLGEAKGFLRNQFGAGR